jgi:hypothetical protein
MSATRRLREARRTRGKISLTFLNMRSGSLSLEDVLRSPPRHLNHVRVHTLIEHAPKMGEAGAKKVLRLAGVWPTDCIGKLSLDQREKIIKHLPPRARVIQ